METTKDGRRSNYPDAPTCPDCGGARTSDTCAKPCLNGSHRKVRESR